MFSAGKRQHEFEASAWLLRYNNWEDCKYARWDRNREFVECYSQAEYDAYQGETAYQKELAMPYIWFGIIVFLWYILYSMISVIYDKSSK